MKLLILDIETQPHLAYVWGLFKENIPIQRLKETGQTLCWAAKWYGSDEVFFESVHKDKQEMLDHMHKLLNEADAVITYNGKTFDIPTLNAGFIANGYYPPSPYKHIDVLETVRKQFRLASNKLEFVAKFLGVTPKVSNRGFDLWIDCMVGNSAAWVEMEEYNRGDVITLEEVYNKILPWIPNHPNHNLFSGGNHVCSSCGGTHLQKRGLMHLHAGSYQRYVCMSCHKWSRATHKIGGTVMVKGAN